MPASSDAPRQADSRKLDVIRRALAPMPDAILAAEILRRARFDDAFQRKARLAELRKIAIYSLFASMLGVPTGHLEWPPPYKVATEQYSPQVSLTSDGELKNYVAGLPFPLLDANDPQAATKIMWNFAFRPLYTDDRQ